MSLFIAFYVLSSLILFNLLYSFYDFMIWALLFKVKILVKSFIITSSSIMIFPNESFLLFITCEVSAPDFFTEEILESKDVYMSGFL